MWPVFADPKTDFVFKRIFGAEQARMAGFTPEEWDAYDRAKIAEQDARDAISLAERQGEARGRQQGRAEGLRRGIEEICDLLAIPLDPPRRAEIDAIPLSSSRPCSPG
jgi:hypothetical protein